MYAAVYACSVFGAYGGAREYEDQGIGFKQVFRQGYQLYSKKSANEMA
jgi:hypothetical protein